MWSRRLVAAGLVIVTIPALAEAQIPTVARRVLTAAGGVLTAARRALPIRWPAAVEGAAQIHRLLSGLTDDEIHWLLSGLPANEIHWLLSGLPDDEMHRLLSGLTADEGHRLLSRLPAYPMYRLLSRLPAYPMYRLLSGLPADERHRLLSRLTADEMRRLLSRLPADERHRLLSRLSYQQQLGETNNKRPETIPDRKKPTIRHFRGFDPVCRPRRNCVPRVVLSDGYMTLSLECAGEKFSIKFPASTKADTPAAPLSSVTSETRETLFWLSIMNSTNPAWFKAYLARFPTGAFRVLAEVRLAALHAAAGDTPRASGRPVSPHVTSSDLHTPPEGSPHTSDFGADWQKSFSLGCDVLALDVSMVTGKVKVTLFGTISFGSDGQATFSMKYGTVSFEASVGVVTVPPAASEVRDALFWYSIVNNTNPTEFEAYLAQFPTGIFSERAQVRLTELRAPRIQAGRGAERNPEGELPLVDGATEADVETAEVIEIKTGGSADAILGEWVNARNREILSNLLDRP